MKNCSCTEKSVFPIDNLLDQILSNFHTAKANIELCLLVYIEMPIYKKRNVNTLQLTHTVL